MKFSGKELDDITGLYDHGARSRNPVSTLWYGIDPLFEKYPDFSPYNYCAGNPVKLVDPDGREKKIFFKLDDLHSKNYYQRNYINGEDQYNREKRKYDGQIHLIKWAVQYKDNKNVVHLFFHGNHNGFQTKDGFETNPENYLLFNSDLYLKNQLEGNTTLVVFHSCSTGSGEGSVAQKLSKTTNTIVIAPSTTLHVSSDYKESVYEDGAAWNHQGSWNIYYKGQLVDELNGLDERWFDCGPWARGEAVDLEDYLKDINVEDLKQKYENKISEQKD